MARIVYFCERSGLPLVAALNLAGHFVFEALAISEILNLIENENVDIVLISPGARTCGNLIASRFMTMQLSPITTAAQVIFELSHLFPSTDTRVQ